MRKNSVELLIKYLLLFVLVLAAGLQTAKLWMDIPTYAMILDRYNTGGDALEEEKKYLNAVLPSTLGMKVDDGYYYIISDKVKGYGDFLSSCDNIIESSMNNKISRHVISTENFDFSLPYILIEYPFALNKEMFLSAYKVDEYPDFPEAIDYILIEDKVGQGSENRVFIHDAKNDLIYSHSINYEDVYIEVDVLNYTRKNEMYDRNIRYELSKELGYDFKKTFLLPSTSEYAILNYSINPYIPFIDSEGVDLDNLDAFVKSFINRDKALESSNINGNTVYIDNNAVIKYSGTGVFEYIEGIDKRRVNENFILDFSSGIDFVDKNVDKGLVEYYLNSYEYLDDGLHIYYDIGYNGIKCDFSKECIENNMTYPMELVVYNGNTVYFKWLLRFMPDIIQQPERVELYYEDVMDEASSGEDKYEELELIYRESEDDAPRLTWHLSTKKCDYYKEVAGE